jgi:hypothetical protein
MMIKALLPTPRTCRRCKAKLFYKETQYMCCKNGNVTVTQIAAPEELRQLFSDTTIEGRHFRQNIRGYNHVMSFTSLGVHTDETVHATSRGIYTFRAQGSIYHKIGGFHPNQGSRPRFLQLYIYDTDNELQNRMKENPHLNQAVVRRLQNMLHQYNPFVHNLRQLALQPNVHECRLLIKERPSNQPQYNLPSVSQVAAVIVGGDDVTLERGRDINIFSNDGNLQKVQETMGYYDPLQYPLLFPFGTYGWDLQTRNSSGTKISCRAYYSYMLQVHINFMSIILT